MGSEIVRAVRSAWERVRRFEYLTRQRASLVEEMSEVETQLTELERHLVAEQRDVAKLQGFSLNRLVASMSGDKSERLTRERVEAEATRLRAEGHRQRLQQSAERLREIQVEMEGLQNARQDYEVTLAESTSASAELGDVGRRLASAEADLAEYEEAIAAGGRAWQSVQAVLASVRSTGGVVTTNASFTQLIKQGQLGQADRAAWQAQQALAEFSRQLDDIGVEVRVELPPADVRWFADMFFDDLISDATRFDRIRQTSQRLEDISRWVAGMQETLTARRGTLLSTATGLRKRWEALLLQSS